MQDLLCSDGIAYGNFSLTLERDTHVTDYQVYKTDGRAGLSYLDASSWDFVSVFVCLAISKRTFGSIALVLSNAQLDF